VFCLITFARTSGRDRRDVLVGAGTLAVIVGAIGVGGLRWNTLDLAAIRGAQAVLGPGVAVGPGAAALGLTLAGAGALVAGAAWAVPATWATPARWWWLAEAAFVSAAVTTVFWWPALTRGLPFGDLSARVGLWLVAVAAGTAAIAFGAMLMTRSRALTRPIAAMTAAGLVIGGGISVATAL